MISGIVRTLETPARCLAMTASSLASFVDIKHIKRVRANRKAIGFGGSSAWDAIRVWTSDTEVRIAEVEISWCPTSPTSWIIAPSYLARGVVIGLSSSAIQQLHDRFVGSSPTSTSPGYLHQVTRGVPRRRGPGDVSVRRTSDRFWSRGHCVWSWLRPTEKFGRLDAEVPVITGCWCRFSTIFAHAAQSLDGKLYRNIFEIKGFHEKLARAKCLLEQIVLASCLNNLLSTGQQTMLAHTRVELLELPGVWWSIMIFQMKRVKFDKQPIWACPQMRGPLNHPKISILIGKVFLWWGCETAFMDNALSSNSDAKCMPWSLRKQVAAFQQQPLWQMMGGLP